MHYLIYRERYKPSGEADVLAAGVLELLPQSLSATPLSASTAGLSMETLLVTFLLGACVAVLVMGVAVGGLSASRRLQNSAADHAAPSANAASVVPLVDVVAPLE